MQCVPESPNPSGTGDRRQLREFRQLICEIGVIGGLFPSFAILHPERGLQDHIASTALVPRLKV